jgi:protein-disulfide isomerase
MMKQGAMLIAVAFLGAGLGAGGVALWQKSDTVGAGANKAAVEKIVENYILTNPEILPKAMANLEARAASKGVNENRVAIETPFGRAWEGAADADVTLVEFFDYACGYCRTAVADVDRLLAEDKKLRIVYREMPVLGEPSINAAMISLAVAQTPNYIAFHKALYGNGRPDDAGIDATLTKVGLSPATIRAAARAPAVQGELARSTKLQAALNLNGTPSWVVGDKVMIGAVGYDALKAAIAETRAGAKAVKS